MYMLTVGIIIFSIIYAVIARNLAKRKGKDVLAWTLLGFLLGLIAIIILACSQDENRRSRTPSVLRSTVDEICADQKLSYTKCGNTLNQGPPKVAKYKCKGCEEMIDTVQCPWCGRKQSD